MRSDADRTIFSLHNLQNSRLFDWKPGRAGLEGEEAISNETFDGESTRGRRRVGGGLLDAMRVPSARLFEDSLL